MKKRILCLMLCLTMVLPMGSFAFAADDAAVQVTTEETASPYFLVDGQRYEDPGMAVYNGVYYVSFVNAMLALRPDVKIVVEGDYAIATADGLTIKARPGDQYIEANGRYLYVLNGVKVENARLLVPARIIGLAVGGGAGWIASTGELELYKGTGAIASGDSFYNSDSVYWLSHIINAESGNQPLDGKLAVGTVIMNRVASPRFPSTIYDVIFAPNQFTPTRNGAINKEPNAESVIAAKLTLEGVRVGGDSLYFVNPNVAPNSWAARNRPYVMTIGGHAFFG